MFKKSKGEKPGQGQGPQGTGIHWGNETVTVQDSGSTAGSRDQRSSEYRHLGGMWKRRHTWSRWCPLFIRPVSLLNITSHCPHCTFPGPRISLAMLHGFLLSGFTVAWFLYDHVDRLGFGANYSSSNPSSSTNQLNNLR